MEAENELYALQQRIKRLKDSKSEGKVPTGLVVHRVHAKGRNSQLLQECFDCIHAKGRNSQLLQERLDAILWDAELKLLDTTIEALSQDK